jgi:hypothetical protein
MTSGLTWPRGAQAASAAQSRIGRVRFIAGVPPFKGTRAARPVRLS